MSQSALLHQPQRLAGEPRDKYVERRRHSQLIVWLSLRTARQMPAKDALDWKRFAAQEHVGRFRHSTGNKAKVKAARKAAGRSRGWAC